MDHLEKKEPVESAHHYDTMGWTIISLYFISLGLISSHPYIIFQISEIFLGYIVFRLFIKCQQKRVEYLEKLGDPKSLFLVAIVFVMIETALIGNIARAFGLDQLLMKMGLDELLSRLVRWLISLVISTQLVWIAYLDSRKEVLQW
jgi:hypothetical protein